MRMIPPFYDSSTVSNGEKKFFDSLRDTNINSIVLHSLGIAEHREKVFGEIDFVIICNEGILCLEVKGGHVRCREGVWYFTDRHGRETAKAEGPFRQVFTGMLSLRDHLRKHFGPRDPVSNCQFACGVVFPDMPFTQSGPDIIADTVFDSRSSFEDIETYIIKTFRYWRQIVDKKHGFTGNNLDINQMNRVGTYLRGDFGFVPSLPYILDHTEEQLLHLTEEQIQRLNMASNNPRILLEGGAGTGKTVISLEHARRQASLGNRVLYLCFNRNLSKHINANNKLNGTNLIVDSFHNFIIGYLKKYDWMPSSIGVDQESYFERILPEAFSDIASQSGFIEQFDNLVIDEGQDLLRLEFLICLDYLLKNGLENGEWHICYDPNQNLFNRGFDTGLEYIKSYNHTHLTLDTNCRNTKPVGVYNTLLTGIRPARFFKVDGENVQRESYTDFTDERVKLLRTVKTLLKQGIRPENIVLLSRFKMENSCLAGENVFRSVAAFQNITDLDPHLSINNGIKFSTIHSFKGLESQVIILLDVDSFLDSGIRLLNYTAISRAKSLLYIFNSKKAEEELEKVVQESALLLDRIEK